MTDTKHCTIYLVRHAMSKANAEGIVGGDLELAEEGEKQAIHLGNKLKKVHFSAIYSSNLKRAYQTAELIAKGRNIHVQKVKDLRERSFGRIENEKNTAYLPLFNALKDMSEEEVWKWRIVDDMETSHDALQRFSKALQKIAKKHLGETILVVAHGNVIRSLLVHIGFASFSQLHGNSIQNASYIVLKVSGKHYEVIKTHGINKS